VAPRRLARKGTYGVAAHAVVVIVSVGSGPLCVDL
jgi:hypothetical protein